MTDQFIKAKAAIAWGPKQPLSIEEIDVMLPRKGEVLVKIVASGVCHTDAFTLSGEDPEGIFPVVLGHEGGGIVEQVGEGVTSAGIVISVNRVKQIYARKSERHRGKV